jgi:hypothetical protein
MIQDQYNPVVDLAAKIVFLALHGNELLFHIPVIAVSIRRLFSANPRSFAFESNYLRRVSCLLRPLSQ